MNSDPHPRELFRAQVVGDGANPVVRPWGTFGPNPDAAPGQVQVVVYQNQVLRLNLVFGQEGLERDTGEVHKRLRFGEQDGLTRDLARSGERLFFGARDADVVPG